MSMVETGKKKYTYDDYAKLPEGAPYQLIGGELVKSPAPTVLHQEINVTLFQKLFQFQRRGVGKAFFAPLDVYLSDTETYQPDLMFISKEQLDIIKEKNIRGVLDRRSDGAEHRGVCEPGRRVQTGFLCKAERAGELAAL